MGGGWWGDEHDVDRIKTDYHFITSSQALCVLVARQSFSSTRASAARHALPPQNAGVEMYERHGTDTVVVQFVFRLYRFPSRARAQALARLCDRVLTGRGLCVRVVRLQPKKGCGWIAFGGANKCA